MTMAFLRDNKFDISEQAIRVFDELISRDYFIIICGGSLYTQKYFHKMNYKNVAILNNILENPHSEYNVGEWNYCVFVRSPDNNCVLDFVTSEGKILTSFNVSNGCIDFCKYDGKSYKAKMILMDWIKNNGQFILCNS